MTDAPTTDAMADVTAERLREQGYTIVADAVPLALCDEILAETARMEHTWKRSLVQGFHGYDTVRYFDLLNGADVFQRPPVLPSLLSVARRVLGDDCLMGTYGTVSIGPGEPAQIVHADDVLYRLPRPHPDMYCNVILALDEFTEANGATRVVPRSNTFADDPVPIRAVAKGEADPRYDTVAAAMPKGGACFVLGSTYHGGGANHTDAPRHGMTLSYSAGWVRPQENFLVAVSQERAATFDPELQALMGYRKGRGDRLGHIYTQPEHLAGPLAHRLVLEEANPVRY